jgi:hypothetical protein
MAQTMNETLQIKITADTSGLTAGVKKVKQDLQGVKKDAGAMAGATASTSASLGELADTMEQVRNMSVFQILRESLKGVGKHFEIAGSRFKNFNNEWRAAFDFKALREGLDDTEDNIFGLASSMRVQLGEAGKSLGGAFKALGAGIKAALTSAIVMIGVLVGEFLLLVAQIRMTIRRAQELAQVTADAAKIGLSVQAYQEWGYVLESVGVQADELTGLIKTLSDEQAQMAEGSEGASKAFEKLGLKVGEVVHMSQEELFTETITRLQGIESQAERTRIAYQIFGEDAAHVANVMNMSSEQMSALVNNYRALGGAASQELINKSNILNMSLSNLRQAWRGLTNALAELFMPAITAVVNWLTKAIAIVRMFIQTIFGLTSTAASGSGSMTSGMNGYTGATNKAREAVEKLKRAQMGFDELNVLPGKDTSGGGSDADLDFGGGIPGGGFELPKIEDLGLDKWREWFAKYKNIIQDITTWSLLAIGVILAVMCFMGGNWLGGIAALSVAGIGLAVGFAEGSTFDRLTEKIKNVWASLKEWWKTTVAPVFTKEYWVQRFAPVVNGFNDSMSSIKLLFSTTWQAIKAWWNGSVAPFFTKAYWATKFENVRVAASEKLTAVKNVFSNAWTNIKNVFSGWGTFFTNLWEKVKSIFKSVGTSVGNAVSGAVKSVINSILKTVESKINSFITMINNAITVINKIPGVNITKLSKITVPKLATGGIVTQSTLANIGEAGAEAVLPLENNTQWMDTLADKIAARNGAPSKIVLMVDGKELGWASINGINNITKQTGNLQLQLI